MAPFCWPSVHQDLGVAREVMSHRPERPAEWEKRVERLSEAFSKENVVN